ncbi:MAG TPA: C69 family dipeptidase [Candidatus Hydrogenedens sp.]|nr:C69 family dipeptidase [Candidatus Hydrogenedens sp.]
MFAKNSDREVNEPQVLFWQPRRNHLEGELLKCTYITIPQVRETYAILISKPTWMWGAEMGTNEFGVTIGNEAVFTNQPYAKTGLTGMDLLRLALERSTSAKQACETIIQLIEIYGQGGNCGFRKNIYYHNSFIVADPYEAYVLETADKYYEIEKIQGARSISNGLTIKGFKEKFEDKVKSQFTQCVKRRNAIEQSIGNNPTIPDMFKLLRLHKDGNIYPQYHWLHGGMDAPCMHAGGLFLNYQTTSSWVSELSSKHCLHWVTATSTPCISLFKPVDILQPLSEKFCNTNNELNNVFWWTHEKFQRLVMKDPKNTFPIFFEEKEQVEHEWLKNLPDPETSFTLHKLLLQQWTEKLLNLRIIDSRPFWTQYFWKRHI